MDPTFTDYQRYCRLCDNIETRMHNVFEKTLDGYQIVSMVKECLPLIIYRSDPLSKQICSKCLYNLQEFYKFRKNVENTLNTQKERLCNHSNRIDVQLFLGTLETCESDHLCESQNGKTDTTYTDRSTSPFENGIYTHNQTGDRMDTELEFSSEHSVELRNKRKRNEGFYAEFEESQDSSITTDITYTESTQNESQSDMDICNSDGENLGHLNGDKCQLPISKRRRVVGPKSFLQYQEKLSIQKATTAEDTYIYNPYSLLRLALNKINSTNVPDFYSPNFHKTVLKSICRYCSYECFNIKQLAVHEAAHINVNLGEKVDEPVLWDLEKEDAPLRNSWLNENKDVIKKEVESDLLVPVSSIDPALSEPSKGEVTLIDGKPMVNGVPLAELPKDERRALYRTITISGLKRKFCPVCRYTFKDNWAIESHYFSSSCLYTCKYCGIRFNKQRYQYQEHVKQHEDRGDEISNKVFAPRKSNASVPKIISETRLKPRNEQPVHKQTKGFAQRKIVKPIKMKHLLERKTLQPNLRVKEEPGTTAQASQISGGSSQAYFCRKCYMVFFKLDEFNVHVVNCSGNTKSVDQSNSSEHVGKQAKNHTTKSPNQQNSNETLSPSGRPIRHCVREIGTYKDEVQLDVSKPERGAHLKSPRGFECGLCNSAFPTVHSRNSHMRIHKNGEAIQKPVNNYSVTIHKKNSEEKRFSNEPQIKQEPLEPIVEINESPHGFPSTIGNVSITPIPKSGINPNIMKLVQNNPHLTIKSMSKKELPQSTSSNNSPSTPANDLDRTYKCGHCNRTFKNKSQLYFHKKNQCGGSKYPCPFCKKRFGTEAAYSSHIFYVHPE